MKGVKGMERDEKIIKEVVEDIFPILNEKQRRLLAGSLAKGYGYGGQKLVSQISGLSLPTLCKAVAELEEPEMALESKIRKEGGGRKSAFEKNPELLGYIEELLRENTYGNPMAVISYTSLSQREIARRITEGKGIAISQNVAAKALEALGYSKQKNQKMEQVGTAHPDRDAQFRHINERGAAYLQEGEPFVSVDCKKKENIGNFQNNGQEYRRKKDARKVLDHDFPIPGLGKVAPYGVYSVNDNTGFINLGTSHDTAAFAVESIRAWWLRIGKATFPNATKLYVTADGGGSNGSRSRLWKLELAKLAQEIRIPIEVSHLPPGTSKWNKIEHRLFCYISKTWAGKPLIDVVTVVKLIGSTTTTKGLKVVCDVDERVYPVGVKVTDKQFDKIDIEFLDLNHGWNYIIRGFVN